MNSTLSRRGPATHDTTTPRTSPQEVSGATVPSRGMSSPIRTVSIAFIVFTPLGAKRRLVRSGPCDRFREINRAVVAAHDLQGLKVDLDVRMHPENVKVR